MVVTVFPVLSDAQLQFPSMVPWPCWQSGSARRFSSSPADATRSNRHFCTANGPGSLLPGPFLFPGHIAATPVKPDGRLSIAPRCRGGNASSGAPRRYCFIRIPSFRRRPEFREISGLDPRLRRGDEKISAFLTVFPPGLAWTRSSIRLALISFHHGRLPYRVRWIGMAAVTEQANGHGQLAVGSNKAAAYRPIKPAVG